MGGLAARVGGSVVGGAAKRITSGRDRALESLHRRTAEQLFDTMADMKGLPMKVGQILSFMDGVIPAEYQPIYAELLSRLQVQAKPWPREQMMEALAEGLGHDPKDAFSFIGEAPLAAASIGQVYRAVRADGREVAVKIQYPNIGDAVTSDLKNANSIYRTLNAVVPNFESNTLARDFLDRIGEECDYRNEANNQTRFAEAWKDDERVIIPVVHEDLSSERVLVTDLHEGDAFGSMTEHPDAALRSAVGEVLFWFVFRSILGHGMFNADPHPGNFLFMPDGRVVFLDFGCVQYYEDETRAAFTRLIEAIVEGRRGDELWEVIAASMEFPDDTSRPLRGLIEEYILFCFEPAIAPQPFRYTRDYTQRLSELTMNAKMTVAKNLLRIGWREPKRQGLVMLSRILFGMNSLLASLQAEGNWREMLMASSRT